MNKDDDDVKRTAALKVSEKEGSVKAGGKIINFFNSNFYSFPAAIKLCTVT
jgi:hypothetical protein